MHSCPGGRIWIVRAVQAAPLVKEMTDELQALIDAARTRPFSEEEREAQRRSFAYGNAKIENDRITWEMIVEADEAIKARIAAQ